MRPCVAVTDVPLFLAAHAADTTVDGASANRTKPCCVRIDKCDCALGEGRGI
jgi:hypothetical protein